MGAKMSKKASFPSTVPTSGCTGSDLIGAKVMSRRVHDSTSTGNHPVRRSLVNADVRKEAMDNLDPGRYLSSDKPRAQPQRNKRIDRANSSSFTDHRKENTSLKVCSPSGTKGSSHTTSDLIGAEKSVQSINVNRAPTAGSSCTASSLIGAEKSVQSINVHRAHRAPTAGSSHTASDLIGAEKSVQSINVHRAPTASSPHTASDLTGAEKNVQSINVHRAPTAGSPSMFIERLQQAVHAQQVTLQVHK